MKNINFNYKPINNLIIMNTENNYRPEYKNDYVSRVFRTREDADREFDHLRERL